MLMELKLRSSEASDRVVVVIVASGITSVADWLGRYLSSGMSSIVSTVSVGASLFASSAVSASDVSANAANGLGVPTVDADAVGVTTFGVSFIARAVAEQYNSCIYAKK